MVNTSGSLLLGVIIGSALHHGVVPVLGHRGRYRSHRGYTTFSTVAFDTNALVERRQWRPALANVVVSLGAGVGAAALGLALGSLT